MLGFTNPLFIGKTSNTTGLNDNCYYCTVAALLGKTVSELLAQTEIMQNSGGGFTDEIKQLFNEAGVNLILMNESANAQTMYQNLLTLANGSAVGLEYRRTGGTQHMVVAVRDSGYVNGFVNAGVKCVDYQQNPPKVTGFPPEPGLVAYRVWFM
jgi:hypothetical protein